MPLHSNADPNAPALLRPTMSAAWVVLILSLLLGLQPITTDLYLPALPALTASFEAPMGQAQLTLTALLLAFGLSQLVWGPLSDRFGRRPILLIGMSAYLIASVASAMAPSMAMLIVWRTMQGAAMGAGVMCARAIVRDLYTPLQGARVMSKGLTGLGIIACASAPLGGLLSDLFSWRIALLALAVFSAVCLAVVALRFTETRPDTNRHALKPAVLLQTWRSILRHPTFLTFSALSAVSYGGLFTFLAASSFVFIRVLGLSVTEYGFVMFVNSLMYVLGTLLCRRLLPCVGVPRAIAIAGVLSLTGGTTMGVLALASFQSVWAIMLPQCLYMLAHGIHQPCSQSGAVGPFPQAAGVASALNGFGMTLVAFAMGTWLGTHLNDTVFPLVLGIWFWSALIALIAWTLVQRYGHLDEH
ncbi:multidrug effflux MFS transporter [Rhodoferax sp. PAMC 29310]|uniref:multidrug effflux MFS transporter n=1 Tax=Rhodoferax sp. PAMC 29310 TaxID=2822760 RepID=UPI001B323E83|nr:multidrug effflux MFS transporter [Rhodoferax sp. PAMC 29310]